jgi:glycosyltransferase 2 family protein
MKRHGRARLLGLVLVIAVFAASAWLLKNQLQANDLTLEKIVANLRQIPASRIVIALCVTVVNYGVILVCYDYLAFRFAQVPISLARVFFAAVTGYAFSYNFGATFAGLPLRYRYYSSWGLPLAKIVQLLVILALTFWFGVFFIAGLLFVFVPLRIPPEQLDVITGKLIGDWNLHKELVNWFALRFANSQPFGCLLLTFTGLYVGTSLLLTYTHLLVGTRFLQRGEIKIYRWTLPVPPFRLTIYQIAIAAADMLVAASVLYVLFPPVIGGYLTVLEVYLVAFSLIVLSHVPGGWGVLEAVMITLLTVLKLVPDPSENIPRVVAAIIAFRVIYYMLPLALAVVMVGWHEYALRKNWIRPLAASRKAPENDFEIRQGMNGHSDEVPADKNAKGGAAGR